MERPSETITATVGSLVGAALMLLGFASKVQVPPEVAGAIVTLVAFVAALVTNFVARKQRAGELDSAVDGTVKTGFELPE